MYGFEGRRIKWRLLGCEQNDRKTLFNCRSEERSDETNGVIRPEAAIVMRT